MGHDVGLNVVTTTQGLSLSRAFDESGVVTETWTFDGLAPLVQSYEVSAAGQLMSVSHPWGAQSYSNDDDGWLSSVVDDELGGHDFALGPLGRVEAVSRPATGGTHSAS